MFKAGAHLNVGGVSYDFEFDGENDMEVLHKVIALSNPRRKCDVCGNYDQAKFKLDTNKDKEGNTYVNLVCTANGCFAKSKLGQYKTKGYFWREFERWEGRSVADDAAEALGARRG